jgi:hypothetical protein
LCPRPLRERASRCCNKQEGVRGACKNPSPLRDRGHTIVPSPARGEGTRGDTTCAVPILAETKPRCARVRPMSQEPTCTCGRRRSIVSGLLFTMKIATPTCEPSARAAVMGFATLNPSYELRAAAAAKRGAPTEAALILRAALLSCAAVLRRDSVSGYLRPRAPPESRSGPFPARPGGAVPIWSRRPSASILARTHGIHREMRACCASLIQAGAQRSLSHRRLHARRAADDKAHDITLATVAIARYRHRGDLKERALARHETSRGAPCAVSTLSSPRLECSSGPDVGTIL